jgi:hypothetical protein
MRRTFLFPVFLVVLILSLATVNCGPKLSVPNAFVDSDSDGELLRNSAPLIPDSSIDIDALEAFKPGVIVFKDGTKYQLTLDDVLWSARMIEGEVGMTGDEIHANWVIWTVAQRKYYLDRYRGAEFKDLIRGFSQPVNPIWQEGGSRCPHPVPGNSSNSCSPERLARRKEISSRPWGSIRDLARSVAMRFASAQLANPVPGVVDFAATTVQPGAHLREAGRQFSRNSANVFYYDFQKRTDSWTGEEVRVVGVDGSVSSIDSASQGATAAKN